jgi:hypothetical protein
MSKRQSDEELLHTEKMEWAAWRDHFTACKQCMEANAQRAILSRGCVKGRAIWTDWHIASLAYIATLKRQRRTA